MFYCSQIDAVELQKELLNEYGYSFAQLTEAAGLGSAAAIVKVCATVWFIVSYVQIMHCELLQNTSEMRMNGQCACGGHSNQVLVVAN